MKTIYRSLFSSVSNLASEYNITISIYKTKVIAFTQKYPVLSKRIIKDAADEPFSPHLMAPNAGYNTKNMSRVQVSEVRFLKRFEESWK